MAINQNHCALNGKIQSIVIEAPYSIPEGTCCTGICTCNVTTQANCTGTWYSGQTCPGSCPACPPSRACCTGGATCNLTYEVNCSGTWKSGISSCAGNPCDGACCDGASCSLTDEAGCVGPNVYKGDGTECTDPDICEPSGACCLPDFGGCSLMTSSNCSAAGGTYDGDDTTCTPSPCPFGHGGPILIA
jgi:hypothetical protein